MTRTMGGVAGAITMMPAVMAKLSTVRSMPIATPSFSFAAAMARAPASTASPVVKVAGLPLEDFDNGERTSLSPSHFLRWIDC